MNITDYEKGLIIESFLETIFLILVTGIFLILIGLVLGFILYFTKPNPLVKQPKMYRFIHFIVGGLIDFARSIPFVILMITIIPLTIILVGTMIGPKAALPALIISAAPFYARVVYNALNDIPKGNVEALKSMGASKLTIIKCLIKESLPSLISGLTIALVTLVGFIASAGAIGSGGLGNLAIRYALANQFNVMYISVGILLLIVFTIQISGDIISKKIDKR